TRDHTPRARARDAAVATQVRLRLTSGQLIVEPEALGQMRVFTPFHRRWVAQVARASDRVSTSGSPTPPRMDVPPDLASEPIPDRPSRGGPEARARLLAFAAGPADRYSADRDRLDLLGTSRLSADLHFGTLSPLTALATVESEAFRRQLAWRDWAAHLLWFDPDAIGDELPWRDDPDGLRAWQEGRTGYPTVDAAMRQLATEGWIANRARMIVASFLTKDLLIDWRAGAAHFLRQLVDADVANNRLGWRWTAGVGPDAAPYVRVLNPVLQGQRFDPDGRWVRRWVPEVAGLPDALVHQPWAADQPPRGYPRPIVDHRAARERALAAFAARARARPPSQ
ncbi:MAG TPA: FAD-binding domain-containing protein, partial [Candidatus Limnocylindrales bacterium]